MKGFKSAIKWIAAIVLICVVGVFLASINGLGVSRTVITVNGNNVTEEEYKFYIEMVEMQVLSEQNITDEAAAAEFLKNGKVGDKAAADYIREEAINQALRSEIAVIKAEEAGVSLTEEERSAVRETEGQKEAIEMYGISEKTYADIMEKSQLMYKYYMKLATEDANKFAVEESDVTKEINDSYALVQHVLVLNKPEDAQEADEAYAAEAKKKAEDVLKKAVSGKDFASLISEYNEDPGMTSSPDGYLISKTGYTLDGQSQMVPEFTKGSFAVSAGEVNPELVESSYGWHIIKRCEITDKNENYERLYGSLEGSLMYEKFEAYLDSFAESLEIVKRDNILNKAKVEY